jgi:hypothetical protein
MLNLNLRHIIIRRFSNFEPFWASSASKFQKGLKRAKTYTKNQLREKKHNFRLTSKLMENFKKVQSSKLYAKTFNDQ